MPSIDERVVSMAFENAKFEAGVAQTMKSLGKLDSTLQQIGTKNSLADIEKGANKVTLTQPMSALDKLRTRLFGAGQGAAQGMSDIENAGNKVHLEQPIAAINKVQSAVGNVGVNASSSFNEVERASGRVSLQGLSSALDSVTAKFSVLQGAAAVALGNITSQAATRGASFLKSFTFAPIAQGLDEYKTNLSSIQTILANTEGQKVSGLSATNKYLQELNTYSDQTIYNFSQMAKNIGTFTAAGVDLPTATASIKGIANLAALSGSSSQQASTAMYQLSQAIAAGRVNLQDWNSVVNAGMGGAKFQKALLTTADNMGTLEKGALKIDKATGKATVNGQSFRESIMSKPGQESWLTSDVLTKTLSQFTGDISEAQLKAQGFNDAQIKGIMATAKSAKAAATEVKTLPQVFDVAKEAIGSGWATTFQNIFGNFKEAKSTFTDLSNFINGAIQKNAKARNDVLKGWKKLGGREDLIAGLKNGFQALMSVLKPIKDAFREIFPRKTAKELADMSWNFRVFMARLKLGPEAAENLKRTFRGLFALLDIGKEIVLAIFNGFKHMLGTVAGGSGSVLEFSGSVGDFIVSIRDWLKEGDRLKEFFGNVGDALSKPLELIAKLTGAITGLFKGDNVSKGTTGAIEDMNHALEPAAQIAQAARTAWDGLINVFKRIGNILAPVVDAMGDAFSQLGDTILGAFDGGNFDSVFAGIQTGLIAGIFLAMKRAVGGGFNFKAEIGGLSDSLKMLTTHLQVMQTNIKATILLKIAAAVGILAVSVALLSTIKPEKIAASMVALAAGLGELVAAMSILSGGGKGAKGKAKVGAMGAAKMPIIAASLILLATAVGVLTASVVALSLLSMDDLAKGIGAMTAMLTALSLAAPSLGAMGPGLAAAGIGIVAIATAMTILAGALKIFATMKWGEMAKGLVGVFVALRVIRFATGGMGPQLILIGPGLILVGMGLVAIGGALKVFATMKVGDLAKGLVAMSLSLELIAASMASMPPTLPLTAAGLILVGIALTSIAGVIALLGNMNIGTLVKGVAAIGAALVVLAGGLTLMIASLPGAAALLVAAGALAILAPVLGIFGNMKFGTVVKGLVAISATMLTIAAVSTITAPALLILGGALSVLSLGVLGLGAGVYLLAKAIQLLAKDGGKGFAVVIGSITAFLAIFPKIVIDFIKGLVDIAAGIAKVAPEIVKSMVVITNALTEGLIKAIPRVAVLISVLIQNVAKIIIEQTPTLINAGFAIILGILSGFDRNIGAIVAHGANIVIKFLNGLAAAAPRLVTAGANLLVNFITGLTSRIPQVVARGANMIATFLTALAERMPRLVTAGAKLITSFINGIANNIGKVINAGGNLIIKIIEGIGNQASKIPPAAVRIVTKFLSAAAKAMLDMGNRIATIMENFLNGLAEAIRTHGPKIRAAGWNVAQAMITGLVGGFNAKNLLDRVMRAVTGLANKLPGWAKTVLRIHSPSKVFHEIGEFTMLGLANGISSGGIHTERAATQAGDNVIQAAQKAMSNLPSDLGVMNLDPVISPVLDLSAVHKEAQKMPVLSSNVDLSTESSLAQATAILAEKAQADQAQAEAAAQATQPSVSFTQNNTSPEALPASEIYRRTNNAVSRIKAGIPVPATT